MIRVILAGVLGAVVYYVWGMMAWMAIPLHTPSLSGLPDEDAIRTALTNQNIESGVYVMPWSDNAADWSDPDSPFTKNRLGGPLVNIFYHREGEQPMPSGMMLVGFVIDLLAALLAASLLSCAANGCCRSYARRVGFVAALGVFVALIGHGSYWNWMYFPMDYTLGFVADVVIGWTLAGLVLAAIVRPQLTAPNAGDKK